MQLPVLRFLLLACLQDGVGDLQLVRGESAEPQLAQAALPKQDVQNERPDLALAPSMSAQVSHVSADCHLAVMHLHLSHSHGRSVCKLANIQVWCLAVNYWRLS